MAIFTDRYPLNVPGKFYIDAQCTDCDLCRECAPNNITRDDRMGHSYVFKQPENQAEVAAIMEGVEGCPTYASATMETILTGVQNRSQIGMRFLHVGTLKSYSIFPIHSRLMRLPRKNPRANCSKSHGGSASSDTKRDCEQGAPSNGGQRPSLNSGFHLRRG